MSIKIAVPADIIGEQMLAEGRGELIADARVFRAIVTENGWKFAEPRYQESWKRGAISSIAFRAEDALDIAQYGLKH